MTDTVREPQRLRPRPARFDLSETPLHWVREDPYVSHLINVLHLVVPVGERWFMSVLRDAYPLVQDERLKADIRGFIGQESLHAHAHDAALAYLKEQGIDTDEYVERLEWFLNQVLGGKQAPPGVPPRLWLLWRISLVAAAEHLTCMLGDWAITADALDRAGADPVMIDMMRWHGSEEIEHCAVAFDALVELGGPIQYPLRTAGMAVSLGVLVTFWEIGLQCTTRQDPSLNGRQYNFFDYLGAALHGRAPGMEILQALGAYVLPGFHPGTDAAFDRAASYLKISPAVRATRA